MRKIIVMLSILFCCAKTELAQTVDDHREWLTETEGVMDVTSSQNRIVVAVREDKIKELRRDLPRNINGYDVLVMPYQEK